LWYFVSGIAHRQASRHHLDDSGGEREEARERERERQGGEGQSSVFTTKEYRMAPAPRRI